MVAPLSDQEDIENTIFTQVSAFYTDNRTTLNAGLGYRRLVSDNTLMLGVNAFYDHEFPYDHGRYSIGLEARSTWVKSMPICIKPPPSGRQVKMDNKNVL